MKSQTTLATNWKEEHGRQPFQWLTLATISLECQPGIDFRNVRFRRKTFSDDFPSPNFGQNSTPKQTKKISE
jgi:hypothetical protein